MSAALINNYEVTELINGVKMKVKTINDFVKYCKDVTDGVCDQIPHLPTVTPQKKHSSTVQILPDPFVFENISRALADLGFKDQDTVDGEARELLLRRLRQLYKEEIRLARKRAQAMEDFEPKASSQFKNEDLVDSLTLFFHKVNEFRIKHAAFILKCTDPSLELVEKMVFAWTGKRCPLDTAVMAHAVSQMKRKLFGLPVTNHIMPILNGAQGAGKSLAILALAKPFKNLGLFLSGSISQLTDERFQKVLGDYYFFLADEMALAERADVNVLKNIITADRLNPRKLGTNSAYDIRQNCTFIGTTNRPVNEMIHDKTGARRFYQIDCLEKMDWSAINSIDYWKLIAGVDESIENGYLTGDILIAVRAEQEKIISHDDIHHFLIEYGISKSLSQIGQFMSNEEIYSKYTSWISSNGSDFRFSKTKLLVRLRNSGFVAEIKKLRGKTQRGLWVQIKEGESEINDVSLHLLKSGGGK